MDLQQTRRWNFKAVVEQWGGATGTAKRLGLAGPSYVSQLVHGARAFTEKTARGFEKQLDLPAGWFDKRHDVSEGVSEEGVRRSITLVGNVAKDLGVNLSPEKFADVVSLVYDQAKEKDVSPEYVSKLIKLAKG